MHCSRRRQERPVGQVPALELAAGEQAHEQHRTETEQDIPARSESFHIRPVVAQRKVILRPLGLDTPVYQIQHQPGHKTDGSRPQILHDSSKP